MASLTGGYASPEEMFEAFKARFPDLEHAWQVRAQHEQALGRVTPTRPLGFALPLPPVAETSQVPRQWNMVTIKRCTVTMQEYRYYGSVETVLQKKGFPAGVPEDGTILLSWFDPKEGTAYYEVARMQDQGELTAYMLAHFKPQAEAGVERPIEFE